MSCLVAFHYRSYGTFFYNKIGSIISIVDLPTTNRIEPDFFNIQEPLVIMQTNDSSYLRRGGLLYAKTDFILQLDFYRRKDINLRLFVNCSGLKKS